MAFEAYVRKRTEDVNRSFWQSLRVFGEIAGKWWLSVWVLIILGGIVSFGLTVTNIPQFSSSVWIPLLALGLVLSPIVAFHFLRVERDKFKNLWDDKEHIISILARLEEFRAKAARIQIEGNKIADDAAFEEWIRQVEQWRAATHETIYLLHPAEAGNFNTLGLFTPELAAGTQILNSMHQKQLLMLIRRIHILEEIRDRWTTRRA